MLIFSYKLELFGLMSLALVWCHLASSSSSFIIQSDVGVMVIVIDPSLVVILRFDDAKLSRHYDVLGQHQIVIFIIVISDAYP